MRVVIIDYGSGNLRSATKAFERAARQSGIAAEIELTADAERVRTADRIVLPGVGAYADCRAGLDAVPGMVDAVSEVAIARARPFLGICVGMQLMSERGLEKTITRGFGWISGDVKVIEPTDPALKIPQIGWNTIELKRPHPLFHGIRTGADGLHAYFVHSYHLQPKREDEVVAIADYGGPVTAAVARDNLAGTQFHPEKSQALGLALIANFFEVEAVTGGTGLPAGFAWARLVPELLVSDLDESLAFWCGMLGFRIAYDRPEEHFAYLDLDGAQLMLEERSQYQRQWVTADLAAPFGRGVNFQVEVSDCEPALERLALAGWPLFGEPEDAWYRIDDTETGVRQFLVQDPDGYLVRLSSPLGDRPPSKDTLQ